MQDLLEEYKETRRMCRRMQAEEKEWTDSEEWGVAASAEFRAKGWGEMASHADYVVRWLETGREPGTTRGIERRAAYQREIPVDPQMFPFDKYMDYWVDGDGVAEKDFSMIAAARELLTEKQWEAFEMYHAGMYTYEEIAEVLGISKPAAFYRVKSAKEKLGKHLTDAT